MDPHSSFQDVPRCDHCETAMVHSYCDFCHANLCKPCIGEHISDGYDKHKIVPFPERRSTLIYPKCGTHQDKNCELQCKDCNIFVCLSCTASNQHKGHNFVEVIEVYKTKKEIIKNDTQEFENDISPTYEKIALDLENQLANLDEGYEKLTTTLSKQGEQWHREIDISINKIKSEIGEIKVKHRDILKKHLDEIKNMQSFIKKTFLALRKIEKSTDISPTIEYRSKIRKFRKLPTKIEVSPPTFIPKPIDCKKLYSLYGHITPFSTATNENFFSQNQPSSSVKEILDEPELVTTIQTEHENLTGVFCFNDDKIWTSGPTNDIKCFSTKCALLQTIKLTTRNFPRDIAINSDGSLLFLCVTTRTVKKVKNGQTKVLITLQGWVPLNLCVTSSADLLVIMYSDNEYQCKVVRYSGPTEKQSIQNNKEGKPLYSGNENIKNITENRNHDICVADCGAQAVVVVNQNGQFKWTYTSHSLVTKKKPFEPLDITTDSLSHILTVDGNNHCIHILDENGQFLRYIDNCDLEYPWGICVDNKNNLFVCELFKGIVKKIKYLR
ncbi:E3 ubiquitin-protein ligase TRIM71-like [Magallana gigas]|uniref:E3 ubiquitin-protein ligase TRIM71-like n=1 Tax=Magallana gigas TaxID=29159 RepID=UPI00333E27E8